MTALTDRTARLASSLALAAAFLGKEARAQFPDFPGRIYSCSPTSYRFALTLGGNCDNNDFDGNPGISDSGCLLEYDLPNPLGSSIPVIITSVQILEFDTSGELIVINTAEQIGPLSDGDTVAFDSVSAHLDPVAPLEEQLDLVPGRVEMVLFGTNAAGEVIRNTVSWSYVIGSQYTPVTWLPGDAIGWITIEDYVPPIVDFCPPTGGPPCTAYDGDDPEACASFDAPADCSGSCEIIRGRCYPNCGQRYAEEALDALCPCRPTEPWENHGAYVSCVVEVAKALDLPKRGKVVGAAAKSDCGKSEDV